jgi:hypothetical protein
MPSIADLIDPAAAGRLAAAVREQASQRQAAEAATPVQATCPECGQPRPVPAAIFSGAGQ